MLIKTLPHLAAVAVLTGGTVVAVQHYQAYQHKQAQKAHVVAVQQVSLQQEVISLQQSAATEKASLTAAYNSAVLQCQKGQDAYTKLAPAAKAKLPAPTCPAPQK